MTSVAGTATPPDIARPISFDARYGAGLGRTLSLGGGGLFFVAWQVAYLRELARRGVDVAGADRMVGTSAGSVVASILTAGKLRRLHTEIGALARVPAVAARLAPAGVLRPSQQRALDLFVGAPDADPDRIRAVGHAALGAATPSAASMPRNLNLVLGPTPWRSDALHITCVDAYTAERCVVTRGTGVSVFRAAAASSAVPGIFAPQLIADRRCMDGGVAGTGVHLDLLAGAARTLVLSLTDGTGEAEGIMTMAPGAFTGEVAELEATGTRVLVRTPETVDLMTLMEVRTVPDAMAMGKRQAATDADAVRAFWNEPVRTVGRQA